MDMIQAMNEFLATQGGYGKLKEGRLGAYAVALNQLCLFLRNKELEKINEKDILAWIKMMRDLGYKPNSFITKVPAVRSFFRYFYRRKKKVLDPELIEVPRQEGKMWKPQDEGKYDLLLGVIKTTEWSGKRDKALILMTMDTGARISEVLSLNIADVDLIEKRAVVKTLKSRGLRPVRELCWTERTNKALQEWLEAFPRNPKDPVWISFCGPGMGKKMAIQGAEAIFKKYSYMAGIPKVRPHELRHRLGHILAKKGTSPVMIANILGHSSIQSSLRYTMLENGEMKEEYHRVMGA